MLFKVPALRRLNPFHLGLVEWPVMVSVLAAVLAYFFRHTSYPSPELMRSLAEIAATFFVGWVVEAVWMALRNERDGRERENWLGGMGGLGLGGVLAIALALLVAAHREAGHANFLDWLGLWWTVVTTACLGSMLAMYPVIAERWSPDSRQSRGQGGAPAD
jgi:hypothetical protein